MSLKRYKVERTIELVETAVIVAKNKAEAISKARAGTITNPILGWRRELISEEDYEAEELK